MERGPRYGAYARLRELRLRMRNGVAETPPAAKKQVRFQGSQAATGRKGSSVLAQSVPDFSAAMRKENRRPIGTTMMTPPAKNWGKMKGSDLRGSRSSGAAEKRVGRGGARKSYANVEDLSSAAARAINAGENRAAGRRTVLGSYKLF